MGDPLHAKIDNFFNVLDAGLEEGIHLIDRFKQAHKVIERADARRQPIEMRPAPPPRGSRIRIIESIDAQTGQTVFVVTDGVVRSECSTRALAEDVKRAMEAGK